MTTKQEQGNTQQQSPQKVQTTRAPTFRPLFVPDDYYGEDSIYHDLTEDEFFGGDVGDKG